MTDYKNLKLIASSSPHIRSKDNTRSIMLDVIIALLPALVMSIYVFGVRALTMVLVSVAACVFWSQEAMNFLALTLLGLKSSLHGSYPP